MRRFSSALFFVWFVTGICAAQAPSRPAPGMAAAGASASGVQLGWLDRAANPCVDFYQFACGGWIAANPIPPDRSRWGQFEYLEEQNQQRLRRILEAAAASRGSADRKIGDYYAACMDEAAIERQGTRRLTPMLEKIDALASVDGLPVLLADLHTIGIGVFFRFGAAPDFEDARVNIAILRPAGFGLPEREYYFREDAKSVALRQQYVEHVGRMTSLLGVVPGAATTAAAAVMRLETALAKAQLDVVSRRDPAKTNHKMSLADLQALTPGFDWSRYLAALRVPPVTVVNLTQPDHLATFARTVTSTPIEDVRAYLRWHLEHASADALPRAFVDEDFGFYGKTLTGANELAPRWKRCVDAVDRDLGEELGEAYIKEAFGPQAKDATLKMVREIEAALGTDIAALDWMTPDTKKQAVIKLQGVADKIGYPDHWRDYTALPIVRDDALGNAQRADAFESRRHLDKIGQPVDRGEWNMTPPTVNAYYSALQNNINFPAGILQPPFYSPTRDAALNYGGAGAVVGHELTHGFDDQGRKYDASGNLRNWWTAEDGRAFESRAACLTEQYAGFTAVDDVKLNGRLTLGENTADNGGLRLAFMAYMAATPAKARRTLDGFTAEQRVFLGWGQVWCESRRPEQARLHAQTNPHSPGRYRVNGVVSNMPEFQEAFSCQAGTPMVSANACRVW